MLFIGTPYVWLFLSLYLVFATVYFLLDLDKDKIPCELCGDLKVDRTKVDGGMKYICYSCLVDGDYFLCNMCNEWHSEMFKMDTEGKHNGGIGSVCPSCFGDM
jgi:hypothetical protein